MSSAATKILLVEDNPSDAAVLQTTLQQAGAERFEFTCVERLDAALARLGQEAFDVLLVDLSLPDSTGAETFQSVRRAAPDVPIVVLTSVIDERTGLEAVRDGVQDYLVKGQADGRQITRAIRYAIERKRAEEALQSARVEAEQRAAELKTALDLMAELDAELRRRNQQLTEEARRKDEFLARLGASLKEKEVLMREIQHRVKNNLQVVSSLLSLQSTHLGDAQARSAFTDCENRVRSMALVHEMLYQSPDLSTLDSAAYMHDLVRHLLHSNPVPSRVEVRVDIDDHIVLSADVAIPCALIVTELVSNALRHAFPDKRQGVISIELHGRNGGYVLKVSDNGIGTATDIRPTSPSLGLKLVTALTRQLDGTLHMRSEGGCEFEVSFSA